MLTTCKSVLCTTVWIDFKNFDIYLRFLITNYNNDRIQWCGYVLN